MFECGHDWGYVGEHQVGESEEVEPHASGSATCAELDSPLVTKIEELGVRVWVDRVWRWWGPAVDEFDEDEGTGPHGSAHVHGPIVLLERNEGVADWELDYWGVCELHFLCISLYVSFDAFAEFAQKYGSKGFGLTLCVFFFWVLGYIRVGYS